LQAWDVHQGLSSAVDEREQFLKGFLHGIGMVHSLFFGQKSKIFLNKQVVRMAATCCRMAYEQHISK
jgi:hypothetical protein